MFVALWKKASPPRPPAHYVKWTIVYPLIANVIVAFAYAYIFAFIYEGDFAPDISSSAKVASLVGVIILALIYVTLSYYAVAVVYQARKLTNRFLRCLNIVILLPFLSLPVQLIGMILNAMAFSGSVSMVLLALINTFFLFLLICFCMMPSGFFFHEWIFPPEMTYPAKQEIQA